MTVPPAKRTMPAPPMLEAALKSCVPDVKAIVPGTLYEPLLTLAPPSPCESSSVPTFASTLPSLSKPRFMLDGVAVPAVFFSVPALLNWPVPPRLFRKSESDWKSKIPLFWKAEVPERMSPAPVKFQVPSLIVTRPPVASLEPLPLTFIVAPGIRRVVPVPVIVPVVQLEAGVGPLIVNVPVPPSTPFVCSSQVLEAGASKLAVPPVISVLVGL